MAKKRISKKTEIIGITGSVGKTTTKEAAIKILSTKFKTHANKKSFNSEFGVPLTLLQENSGHSSPGAWLKILVKSFSKAFSKLHFEKIILELGVDSPGDMSKLLELVQPKIGVVLAIKPVHLAEGQFKSVRDIAKEKGLLINKLPPKGVAILNADDPFVAEMKTTAKKITFGIKNSADLQARNITETIDGLTAQISWQNQNEKLVAPILGKHNLTSLLAAIAIGLVSGIELKECVKALASFRLPPGRLNLLEGINGSKIIDGSYNANPASVSAALETLKNLETSGKKIAVLGQMNELGTESKHLHNKVAEIAANAADEVIGVFGDAVIFTKKAQKVNKPAKFFETAEEASKYLKNNIQTNDLVLIKGSQNNVRLEKCVKKILLNPTKDSYLLCRQEKEWL